MLDLPLIRKLASLEAGRRYLEGPREDSLDAVYQSKLASAEDKGLLVIASRLPGDLIENYEALGGKYKSASFFPEAAQAASKAKTLMSAGRRAAPPATTAASFKPSVPPPMPKTVTGKTGLYGQHVPEVAALREQHAVEQMNKQLAGATSLLKGKGSNPAFW